ncbi:MAG: ABC transporter permease [Brachymonas sp.]|nr:ABC transporter permease [Brachymonas sp.]
MRPSTQRPDSGAARIPTATPPHVPEAAAPTPAPSPDNAAAIAPSLADTKATAASDTAPSHPHPSRFHRLRQRALRHPGLWLGGGIALLLLGCALLSLVWTPHPPTAIQMHNRLAPASAQHWLGTDALGRDVASQLLVGVRSPLLVGLGAVGMGLIVGSALGLLAAQQRGWVEAIILKCSDVAFAFPALLTAIMLAAVWGSGPLSATLAIGLFNIPTFARISRAGARTVWTREFVQAARVAGKPRWRITLEHVLPHVAPVLIVQASVQFALAILAEAGLSYLGLGTQPPQPSWGRMLADAQTLLYQRPLLAVYPGLCIVLAVLGLNFLGDGLRDVLDPKMDVRLR